MQAERKSTRTAAADRDHVASLEKGLAVLDILAARPWGLTLSEVADAVGLTRAGARRLLLTLTTTGHARQDGRKFTLSPKLLALARTWLNGVSLWDFALPYMRDVALALDEACSAAVLADTDVVYVARVPGVRIMSVTLNVGTRLPAYCTSMGRVLMADLAPPERAALLARADLRRLTPKTVTDAARLDALAVKAAHDGYALVDEELELGLRSISVPIRGAGGRVVAAINVPAQTARFSPDELREVALPHLRRAAAAIEAYFVMQ